LVGKIHHPLRNCKYEKKKPGSHDANPAAPHTEVGRALVLVEVSRRSVETGAAAGRAMMTGTHPRRLAPADMMRSDIFAPRLRRIERRFLAGGLFRSFGGRSRWAATALSVFRRGAGTRHLHRLQHEGMERRVHIRAAHATSLRYRDSRLHLVPFQKNTAPPIGAGRVGNIYKKTL